VTILLLAAALALPARPQTPVFRAEVGVVRVEVLVTRGGEPVRGLRARHFELLDDGRAQALEPIVEETAPVDALLLLDLSVSVRGPKLAALKDAARAFLDGLRPGERAALVAFHHEVQLLEPLTEDLGAVRRALEETTSRGSTALRDALYAALRLKDLGERRTAVVVFSDGRDTMSWLEADEVVEAARRSNAIVYAVTVRAPGERSEPFLDAVSKGTGGRRLEAVDEDDLQRLFLDVLADIRARYVLSFTPADARPGWHALRVRLRGVRGDVLARPGYWRAAP
jgi:VWFA-related protein